MTENRHVSPETRALLVKAILPYMPGPEFARRATASMIVTNLEPIITSIDANAHARGRVEAINVRAERCPVIWPSDSSRCVLSIGHGEPHAYVRWVHDGD